MINFTVKNFATFNIIIIGDFEWVDQVNFVRQSCPALYGNGLTK